LSLQRVTRAAGSLGRRGGRQHGGARQGGRKAEDKKEGILG